MFRKPQKELAEDYVQDTRVDFSDLNLIIKKLANVKKKINTDILRINNVEVLVSKHTNQKFALFPVCYVKLGKEDSRDTDCKELSNVKEAIKKFYAEYKLMDCILLIPVFGIKTIKHFLSCDTYQKQTVLVMVNRMDDLIEIYDPNSTKHFDILKEFANELKCNFKYHAYANSKIDALNHYFIFMYMYRILEGKNNRLKPLKEKHIPGFKYDFKYASTKKVTFLRECGFNAEELLGHYGKSSENMKKTL